MFESMVNYSYLSGLCLAGIIGKFGEKPTLARNRERGRKPHIATGDILGRRGE